MKSPFYRRFKTLLAAYASIIKVGLFGHHNYAFVEEIISTSYLPLIPSIIAPGVSPRGKNNPAFNVIYRSKDTKTILDFKQMKLNLFHENRMAQVSDQPDYLGKWSFHSDLMHSWRTLRWGRERKRRRELTSVPFSWTNILCGSGEEEFTAETLFSFLERVPNSHQLFQAMQIWRTAGYIGEDTPEGYRCRAKYDQGEPLMKCLFPEQNASCWSPKSWLVLWWSILLLSLGR